MSPPPSMPGCRCATCRRPPRTPTRAPPCATTGPGRRWTGTPPISSPRSSQEPPGNTPAEAVLPPAPPPPTDVRRKERRNETRCAGRSLQLAGECPLDESAVVVYQAGQGPQVNDSAVAGRDKVDDLADRRGVLVTCHDQGARRDLGRVSGLIQERPQVTGVILVVEVSGDIDPVHFSPPLARH